MPVIVTAAGFLNIWKKFTQGEKQSAQEFLKNPFRIPQLTNFSQFFFVLFLSCKAQKPKEQLQ